VTDHDLIEEIEARRGVTVAVSTGAPGIDTVNGDDIRRRGPLVPSPRRENSLEAWTVCPFGEAPTIPEFADLPYREVIIVRTVSSTASRKRKVRCSTSPPHG
jgi:hypothetical protein